MWKLILILTSLISSCPLEAYRILMVSPTPSKSHAILGDAMVKHLAEAGHEITYITAFPPKKSHPRVTVVDVSDSVSMPDELNVKDILDKKLDPNDFKALIIMIMKMSKLTLNNSRVQNLIADKDQQYDVIIAEWMVSDIFAGFAALFNCPLIWFSTIEPHWMILQLVDEAPNPAYTVSVQSASFPPLSFKDRVGELWSLIFGKFSQYLWLSDTDNGLYEKYFVPSIRARGHTVQPFDLVKYNGSLILVNSHVSMGTAASFPQNVIPIGGFHIDENVEPLPQNLQKLMDEAKHGVIFFSMGSNLKSKHFPVNIKRDLLQMFGKLKQTVLWKFEEDLPDRPSNVHILSWALQQSILAHKNCIIFITHGGLLSSTESIHFGIPMIGIPGFGDQFINVNRYVNKGIAKRVDLSYALATDLQIAIQDILNDPKYTMKAKELSMIYHDRPIHPGKELVHWVEHVVRTQGARHLRSPAFLVPWYQKMYLDLLLVILILIVILKYIVRFIKNKLFKVKLKVN